MVLSWKISTAALVGQLFTSRASLFGAAKRNGHLTYESSPPPPFPPLLHLHHAPFPLNLSSRPDDLLAVADLQTPL
jgi:hypothetical protein